MLVLHAPASRPGQQHRQTAILGWAIRPRSSRSAGSGGCRRRGRSRTRAPARTAHCRGHILARPCWRRADAGSRPSLASLAGDSVGALG
jgi:hypothetical protein